MNATAFRQAETKIFVCQHPFWTAIIGMIVTGRCAEQKPEKSMLFSGNGTPSRAVDFL